MKTKSEIEHEIIKLRYDEVYYRKNLEKCVEQIELLKDELKRFENKQ